MSTIIKGRDFIFTGLQPWDMAIGSNARDIATEISKNNRVLYVNTPLSRLTNLKSENPADKQRKSVVSKECEPLRRINENLWVLDFPFTIMPINSLPDGILFDIANRLNNLKMYSFVKKIANKLQFKDYILFIDNDIFRSFYAKEYLQPALSVYYRRDNMVSDFWAKHAPRLEPKISAKCDCVLANSEQLATTVRPYNNHSYDVGQGVDLRDYDCNKKYNIPQELENIPRPIIGYTGMITSLRLDADLLCKLAQAIPDCSFVFVGGADKIFKSHPIVQLKNVFFLGMKDSATMPYYISAFDICINPQILNHITIGNYPRKIDEYLALGKPVVATKTDTMSIFQEHVSICTGVNEYKMAIEKYLENRDNDSVKQERVRFANTHSWEDNVKNIYLRISERLNH